MQTPDQKEFFRLLLGLTEIYGKDTTPEFQMLYWNCLKKYDLKAVTVAVNQCCTDVDIGQFMPKPADIIRQIEGGTEDRSLLAWTKVTDAIRLIGSYQTVVFDDPIIHAVLRDMGGWIKACEITTEEMPFVQKEFSTRYRGYVKRQVIPKHDNKLLGVTDLANTSYKNHAPELPRFIGDRFEAQKVLDGRLQPEDIIKQLTEKAGEIL